MNLTDNSILTYSVEYAIGDLVYLRTDPQQEQRIVTAICIRITGVSYCLMCGLTESWHYGIEISKDKDILKAIDSAPIE